MHLSENHKRINKAHTELTIIWFALLGSCFVYGFVLHKTGKLIFDPVELNSFTITFSCMALITPVAGMIFKNFQIRKAKNVDQVKVAYIVAWALAESSVIYGLVIAFQSGNATPFASFLFYSACFFFAQRPSKEVLKACEKKSLENLSSAAAG